MSFVIELNNHLIIKFTIISSCVFYLCLFFLSVSMIATRTLIYLPNTLYLFLVPRISFLHLSLLVSSFTAQTSRRRYSLVHKRSADATRAHGGSWLENGWTELRRWDGQENGRRDARRRAPGAGCPRLGTTTAMFVGRNGRKKEPSQGMRVPTTYFRRTSGKHVAEKERPVVTARMREKGALVSKCWRGEKRCFDSRRRGNL